ncbi:MAG TPA: FAD-binding protein, partial [Acidimicrobiales bacterium]|nr:FAD-binding protein [Acidimicrobiales bacterium]
VGPGGLGVFLDFSEAIQRLGIEVIKDRYGNLFDMYERITAENPYQAPMRIYPAVHYTMGGLWVDYDLMSTVPGLFVTGEANFSDHGANRLGASALMQGLADGYFILPYTLADYLAEQGPPQAGRAVPEAQGAVAEVAARVGRLLAVNGSRTADSFSRELGQVMWDHCGMARNEAGLRKALDRIPELREEFWQDLKITGTNEELNPALEKAGRVADFLELAELICIDALHRSESCGGHFREESQTPDGEALRDDEAFSYVAGWEFTGVGSEPVLHKEPLVFESVHPSQRSYK